jgi:hypothetical protein
MMEMDMPMLNSILRRQMEVSIIKCFKNRVTPRCKRVLKELGSRGFLDFFQDRLIKEMRLKGIKDYETANKFLKEEFLSTDSKYGDLPEDIDLEQVFTIKHR